MRLVLVDAANCLYRAFFALPPLRTSDGFPTNALHGFAQMLRKVLREERPTAMAVVFDPPGKGFRHALHPAYKGTREAQPEDLTAQFPVARELVVASGIALLEVPGFEADDVIASIVAHAPPDAEVEIISTDRDLMQLVSERVRLVDTMRDRRYGPAEVEERFGVPPASVLDVRALVGDSTDNIPGVKGIGEKGAAKLIREFGSLEALLERAGEVSAKRAREALEREADAARLSKELATLRADAPGCDDPTALALRPPDVAKLRELYARLELRRLQDSLEAEARAGAPAPEPVSAQGAFGFARPGARGAPPAAEPAAGDPAAAADAAGRAPIAPAAGALAAGEVRVERADDKAGLARLVRALASEPRVAAAFVGLAGPGGLPPEPAGVALASAPDRATYVPLGGALQAAELAEALAPVFAAGGTRRLVSREGKRIQSFFAEQGQGMALPAFDVELAAFLLDPAAQSGTPVLAAQQLGRRLASFEELAGRGAKATTLPRSRWTLPPPGPAPKPAHARPRGAPRRAPRARRAAPAVRGRSSCRSPRVLAAMEREGVRHRRSTRSGGSSRDFAQRTRRARGGDLRARRRGVPDQLAEAAPGDPVREARAPRRRRRRRRPATRRTRACSSSFREHPLAGKHPRLPAARRS